MWSAYFTMAQGIAIHNIDKSTSFSGDLLTITGNGFSNNPENLKVSFGAVAGDIICATPFLIKVTVPAGATYDNITVSNLTTGLSAATNTDFLLAFGGESETPNLSPPTDFKGGDKLYDLCLCDFNNDKKIDVASANGGFPQTTSSTRITVLKNTRNSIGQVQFDRSSLNVGKETQNVQCADLNNDGKPEIILSISQSDKVIYLKNTSTEESISFAPPEALIIDGNLARRIEVADLDLDGKPEIIVNNQGNGKVNIFKNISTSSKIMFNQTPIVFTTGTSKNVGLKVKDLNNDKFPDIVITPFLSSQKTVYILENQSSTGIINFMTATSFTIPPNDGSSIVNIAIGTLNNDQKPDIIVTIIGLPSKISILENTTMDGATISFNSPQGFMSVERPWGVDLGDLNGDGKLDIAVASINEASRFLNVFINKSMSNAFSFDKYEVETNEKSRNIKIGDIDGNGKPDLIFTDTGSSNNKISIITNQHCLVPKIFGDDNRTLCVGSELRLQTSGAPNTTYVWSKNDEIVKRSNEPFYIETVNAPGNFTYKVIAEGGGVCPSPSVMVDVINPSIVALTGIEIDPNIPTSDPPTSAVSCEGFVYTVCEGKDFTLEALSMENLPASATFVWTKPDNTTETTTTHTLEVTNAVTSQAGQYQVEMKVGSCVSNSVNAIVQIVPTASVQITSSAGLSFCTGQSTTLAVPQLETSDYQWSKNGASIAGGDTYKIDIMESGEYTVQIETKRCIITPTAVTVDVYDKPIANFENSPICTGQEVTFCNKSMYRSDIAPKFEWDFGDSKTSEKESPTHTYRTAGNFTVMLKTSYDANCSDTYQQSVTVNDADIVTISSNNSPTTFCEGGSVMLSVPPPASEAFRKYRWNDGGAGTDSFITVTESGIYTVSVTNDNGCTSMAEIEVEVLIPPEISIEIVNKQGEVQLIASGGVRYEWTEDNTLSAIDQPNPVVTPETTTTYSVTGFDNNGCSNTATITVEVNPSSVASKVFTPNKDGQNDVWVIKNIDFPNCTVLVFNRSGQVVFEQKNYANDWDGTFNGKNLQEGVYYYIIKCDNNSSLTGSVTIFR